MPEFTVKSVLDLYALALSVGQIFAREYHQAARQMRGAGDAEAASLFELVENLECTQALEIDRLTCGARLPPVNSHEFFGFDRIDLGSCTDAGELIHAAIAGELTLRSSYVRLGISSRDKMMHRAAMAIAVTRDRHLWLLQNLLVKRELPGPAKRAPSFRLPHAAFAL